MKTKGVVDNFCDSTNLPQKQHENLIEMVKPREGDWLLSLPTGCKIMWNLTPATMRECPSQIVERG